MSSKDRDKGKDCAARAVVKEEEEEEEAEKRNTETEESKEFESDEEMTNEEYEEEEEELPSFHKGLKFRNYRPRDPELEVYMLEKPVVPNLSKEISDKLTKLEKAKDDDVVLVCGSLYLASDVKKFIK